MIALLVPKLYLHVTSTFALAQWIESFSKHLWVAFVVVFLAEWAGYLAVAGLNLLAQISDRISPSGV